jgi:hypothetical protein
MDNLVGLESIYLSRCLFELEIKFGVEVDRLPIP